MPERPPFAGLSRFTVKCADCGAGHLLFDNRFHGYDGAVCGTEISPDYEPEMKQKFARQLPERRIRVRLECTVSELEFAEITDGAPGTESLFSECFTWITLSAEDADGKYRSFFDCETG